MRAYLMSLAVAAPALLLGLTACNNSPALSTAKANEVGAAAVNSERLINADREPDKCVLAHEQRLAARAPPLNNQRDMQQPVHHQAAEQRRRHIYGDQPPGQPQAGTNRPIPTWKDSTALAPPTTCRP